MRARHSPYRRCQSFAFVLALALAFSCESVRGAEKASPSPKIETRRPRPESLTRRGWEDFRSPVTTDASYALIAGGAATAILSVFKNHLDNPNAKAIADRKPLGQFSKTGDLSGQLIPNGLYFAGMLAHGLLASDSKSESRAYLMLRASLHATVAATLLKHTVREPRPNNGGDLTSFPSGHSADAFAFAAVVGAEHGWYFGAPAYALASFVAFSRGNDGVHFYRDVMAGATIGISYGLGICMRERQRKAVNGNSTAADREGVSLALLPFDDLSGMALALRTNL
ncbi:MAG: phosphatase PAP2 family protein [Deltaproteobacteria bacterium]|nr:phosphatase PAP2 family protein [Deltaproteobacteria bacterium]